jgi:hypothetical protein
VTTRPCVSVSVLHFLRCYPPSFLSDSACFVMGRCYHKRAEWTCGAMLNPRLQEVMVDHSILTRTYNDLEAATLADPKWPQVPTRTTPPPYHTPQYHTPPYHTYIIIIISSFPSRHPWLFGRRRRGNPCCWSTLQHCSSTLSISHTSLL